MRESWNPSCACGGVALVVTGKPEWVNACTCLDCQKSTGSVMSWTAFFAASNVTRKGMAKSYRTTTGVTTNFCTTCGTILWITLEDAPDLIGVGVGLLGDPEFEAPKNIYWTCRKPAWLPLPTGIKAFDQGG
jgi:hypothetical protein